MRRPGATVASDFFRPLERARERAAAVSDRPIEARLVYGGDARQHRAVAEVVPWHAVQDVDWRD